MFHLFPHIYSSPQPPNSAHLDWEWDHTIMNVIVSTWSQHVHGEFWVCCRGFRGRWSCIPITSIECAKLLMLDGYQATYWTHREKWKASMFLSYILDESATFPQKLQFVFNKKCKKKCNGLKVRFNEWKKRILKMCKNLRKQLKARQKPRKCKAEINSRLYHKRHKTGTWTGRWKDELTTEKKTRT